jgi:hypothetical protein
VGLLARGSSRPAVRCAGGRKSRVS